MSGTEDDLGSEGNSGPCTFSISIITLDVCYVLDLTPFLPKKKVFRQDIPHKDLCSSFNLVFRVGSCVCDACHRYSHHNYLEC